MDRTIVGLFHEMSEAETAVRALARAGFPQEQISLVTHRAACGPAVGPIEGVTGRPNAGSAPVLGGLAGFTTGPVATSVPGIGPVLAAGPIAAELAAGGAGTVAGLIFGRMKNMGISDDDANCFCEAIRRGGVIVALETTEHKAAEAERIIGEHNLADIEDCATSWRQAGWTGFDATAEPIVAAETREQPQARAESRSAPVEGLPFDPDSIRPSVRQAKRDQRAVRSYFRVT